MYFQAIKSPIGPLTLFADEEALVALEFGQGPEGAGSALLKDAQAQLKAYFAGKLKRFDLPLNAPGTPFQKSVWHLMREIPYGVTRSYGDLAYDLDSGPRAVGGACGKNPIAIIVPCHRVVAAGEKIGGFSGGTGIDTKTSLLRLEGVTF
ncbi:MAG: methylated-DNA--[protein]-cysteine S-methyltransferase [Rhodospirillaceae bacterium]|jgi:methylated-DNA-[protein]-cysteine S-methyltransferase|nr:methylated-DNA--[protein]-cysteine S-methyltransferase [Rhodospirillaceae bacterium]MBT5242979.1 methylated-DNA--[protein]-cysteine S-methyltransferase [Rhodospirillaceae bacterium]MBT5563203.1 methylated-DNA--[protein]-cysteine S-methyltransferase [Rhodospirillaceae bacterium]MBT6243518.1 methylated-DNA--[protein]-cysteine S-methyltransferase [Rhodospirillaceae bacterium]MBT7138005.1 methylated-DNA--[protein]-cysteine S-methyltransferase [Rhodospirillaceae bacterium]